MPRFDPRRSNRSPFQLLTVSGDYDPHAGTFKIWNAPFTGRSASCHRTACWVKCMCASQKAHVRAPAARGQPSCLARQHCRIAHLTRLIKRRGDSNAADAGGHTWARHLAERHLSRLRSIARKEASLTASLCHPHQPRPAPDTSAPGVRTLSPDRPSRATGGLP